VFASAMHSVGHASLALAAGVCAQALGGGGRLLGAGSSTASTNGAGADLAFRLALVGLGAVAVKVVGGAWAAFAQARICGDVGAALRLEVLDGWLAHNRLRAPRLSDHGALATPARGVAALTSHVRELEVGLHVGVMGGARAVAQLVPLAIVLAWMAPRLAIAALLVLVPFSAGLSVARRRWKGANARAARHGEALLEAADEAVRHADLWTTYGAEARVRAHVAAIGEALARNAARVEASAAGLSGANELLGALALVLALGAARAGWLGEAASAQRLLPFAVVFFLAYRPLRDLTDSRLALTRATVAWEALAWVVTAAGAPRAAMALRASETGADLPGAWSLGALSVERLVLAHGASAPLTFRAEPGALVCIVGATGSGKTTLLRALLGLEPACAGSIRYDGADLGDAPPGPRARPFAWVPQDAPVLADSLDANVALAGPADSRAVLAALGAEAFARSVGEARLGAGGREVSGGERQWIALARAVATRLPVLLLDEPTSGLDAASQARVLDAIARLKGERTILLVTHRPEPLAIADAVVRIDAPPVDAPLLISHRCTSSPASADGSAPRSTRTRPASTPAST
jgi:ABC-type multidrug transport system fused ATPase/permease subunit